MIFRSHTVEDHPDDFRILAEVLEAIKKRTDRISRRACIHQEHRGDAHSLSYGRRRAVHTHVAVIEPHHPLEDDSIRLLRVTCIDGTHVLGAHHKEIQIDRRATAG